MLGVIVPFADKGLENFLKAKDAIVEECKMSLRRTTPC
jgi:hypothetical protein